MDLNQGRLKTLMKNTDKTFEQYKQHPDSKDYALAYEHAKIELNEYLAAIRQSSSHPK
ncbi:hypothetical protein L0668_05790 [Paraglaciecola aquimarina]|uniref:Lacal_2735 family protein n=1 Tax=Paraglaciecola algarum TaxID=3050085 RepID=A0ABS9D595_9ALTE|nr:hypothetical protein [Paraglaciecola sp. G1-23]MCF2947612.1 hypothetical protein [Paraglaciecola sp. G1-23]